MSQSSNIGAVESFYETHPISEKQIRDKLKAEGVDLSRLTEDILQSHDQDHFGGTGANDILAARADIDEGVGVLDVCSGLGGPARYLAQNYDCRVTGVDLTESRVEGARRLTALTGLDDRANFVSGDALALPFEDRRFDVVIAQEAFCHIPNKPRLVAECARVLKPGGRIAFTDILATDTTAEATRVRLTREMAFNELGSFALYRSLLEDSGCAVVQVDDLGREWTKILVDRLAMYRSLKDQTIERFGAAHFETWDRAYSFFVAQYATGELSGGRFLARRVAN
ncbi:methyltransferase domain-containing protein [Pikeienuella piscinae]|uniref:Methyltransferase domain-containing protein n=1 Tax=Pikeienuella piscinae TaxID=2748098 RepID=A0A7L5BXN4_9RHOB|nr:class I SAM-dependent methyltransferase [Pikeienuella piscinae]QIE55287.1 methyltransferase domain-containing protein [Pikeienuella piscinae]